MREGRWNPEVSKYQDPIIISKNGKLLNGQHRCRAVIESNTPVYEYVEDDVDESIYRYLDDGERRGARDYVKTPNAHAVASLAKIMCAVEDGATPLASALQGKVTHRSVASRQQIVNKIDDNEDRLLEYIRLSMRAGTYLGNKRGAISAALFIIDYCGRGDMLDMFVDECSALVPQSQPVIVLRSYVAKCLCQANFKADSKWMCSCIFSAYEAFRNNTEIKTLNKLTLYFSQYDKLVEETRNK
jgi:hypothetical protein